MIGRRSHGFAPCTSRGPRSRRSLRYCARRGSDRRQRCCMRGKPLFLDWRMPFAIRFRLYHGDRAHCTFSGKCAASISLALFSTRISSQTFAPARGVRRPYCRIVVAQPVEKAALRGETLYQIETGLHTIPTQPSTVGAARTGSLGAYKTLRQKDRSLRGEAGFTAGLALPKSECGNECE